MNDVTTNKNTSNSTYLTEKGSNYLNNTNTTLKPSDITNNNEKSRAESSIAQQPAPETVPQSPLKMNRIREELRALVNCLPNRADNPHVNDEQFERVSWVLTSAGEKVVNGVVGFGDAFVREFDDREKEKRGNVGEKV